MFFFTTYTIVIIIYMPVKNKTLDLKDLKKISIFNVLVDPEDLEVNKWL